MASTPPARKVCKNSPFYEKIARVDVFRENAIRLYFECMEWTYDAENRKIEKASKELYPRDKWPDGPYNIQDGDFFLNSAKVIASGIFKGDTALRRAIKELVKYGFIVCIVQGKTG